MPILSVKFNEWDITQIRRIIAELGGGDTGFYIEPLRIVKVAVPEGVDVDELRANFARHPFVERATVPARLTHAGNYHVATNDALLDQQWHLKRMNAFHAWKHTHGDPAIKFCIIDDGIANAGEFLNSVQWDNSFSYLNDPPATGYLNYYADPNSETLPGDPWLCHGMMVQSCTHPLTNNGQGIAGLCHDTTPYVIVDALMGLDSVTITGAAALVKAVEFGAKIISCSWGAEDNTYPPSAAFLDLYDATQYAWENDAVVVIAAMNSGKDLGSPTVHGAPAEYPHMICAGAVDEYDNRAIWPSGNSSNYGVPVTLCAPGSNIYVYTFTPRGNGALSYQFVNGTSFATPLIAAVAALVRSVNPLLTNQETVDILLGTADAFRSLAAPTYFPSSPGVANAAKAVLKALTTVPANTGAIYPYLNFWGVGVSIAVNNEAATTTLNGGIYIELGGYSTDPVTSVEFWVDGIKLYDGPPNLLSATASNSGAAAEIKVVVRTATGFAEEIYSDIVVTSITNIVSLRAFFPQSLSSQSTIGNIVLSSSSTTVLFPASMSIASEIGNITLWSLDNLTLYPDALSCDAQIGQIGLTLGPTFSVAGMAADSEISGLTLQTTRLPSLRKWDGVAWSDAILKNSLGMIITPKRYIDGQWQ